MIYRKFTVFGFRDCLFGLFCCPSWIFGHWKCFRCCFQSYFVGASFDSGFISIFRDLFYPREPLCGGFRGIHCRRRRLHRLSSSPSPSWTWSSPSLPSLPRSSLLLLSAYLFLFYFRQSKRRRCVVSLFANSYSNLLNHLARVIDRLLLLSVSAFKCNCYHQVTLERESDCYSCWWF